MRPIQALTFVVVFALGGCMGVSPQTETAKRAVDLPKPPKVAPEYNLQPGDVMDVKFALNPELNESLVVRPDGRVSMPLAPEVMAGGRSVAAVQRELSDVYSRELKEPRLSVILRSFVGARIYVAGEVPQPGELVSVGPITALQAIYRAGGHKNLANLENVVMIRKTDEGPQYYILDLKKVLEGKDLAEDVQLTSYDVIYVPRTSIGNVAVFFQEVVRPILPVSFGLTYPLRSD